MPKRKLDGMTIGETKPELTAGQLPTKAMNLEDLHEVLEMYNEVTRRLEGSHARLEAEVVRLREQLEQKNKELEHKKRLAALGEMAAGIAHEIRNPLGAIQLYASTLAGEVARQPVAEQLAKKISVVVKNLNSLVCDMLTFTQNIAPDKRPTDLADLVGSAVDLATPALLEANVDVRIDDSLEGRTVMVDAKLLRQVLLNLVLNAAQAIAGKTAAGLIAISASSIPGTQRWSLVVDDSGPGIPADSLEKIFNPFFTTKHTGTGLGLAIVHRIIEAHGGTIVAENRAEGGARFVITMA